MAERPSTSGGDPLPAGHPAGEVNLPGRGFRIGEYVIDKTLGHGAMGTVYLAHDGTGHEVALKLFQEGPGVSATMLERFRREAEASKKLRRHPNVMKVYATGQESIYHYIVMEPIHHSRTLDDLISNSPTDIPAITRIIIKIARALQFAHSRNIIHRDVKPSNIMIDEFGEPLLTDFGVAAINDWPGCTMTGALTGTPLYMSPEQARSERAGPESDIYSLGVVLYEALTGALPYSAQHASPVKSVLEAVKAELPVRPRSVRKEISPDLEAIIMKALAKNPDERYPDADAFANDLERALAGHHVTAHLFTVRDRMAFLLRRHRNTAIGVGAACVLLVSLAVYYQLKLRASHQEYLLTIAHLRNNALMGPRGGDAREGASGAVSSAQQEWFVAMRAMNQGQYPVAVRHLEATIQLSQNAGDARTRGRAEKELARIKTLEGDHDAAMTLYRRVIANTDTPAAEVNQAQLEALLLALLHDRRQDMLDLIANSSPQSGNIFRNAIRCLTGEISAEAYRDQIPLLPARLQNDAYLAVALRYRLDNDAAAYQRELRQVIRGSSPAREWPGPLARQLFEEARAQ